MDNPGACISAFVDVDGDGDQDLLTGSCNLLIPRIPPGPFPFINVEGPILLMKNMLQETGALSFVDVTKDVFGELKDGLWMGISMADVNSDGRIDFFIGNTGDPAENQQHLMLVSLPDGTYRNESVARGLAFHEFNWGSTFIDFENDGNPDLVTVGTLPNPPEWIALRNPGRMLVNNGYGSFEFGQGDLGLSRFQCAGLAAADYDEDGSQDFMVMASTAVVPLGALALPEKGRLLLFKGTADGRKHVGIGLEGVESNRQGIGASVQVCASALGCQLQVVTAGVSFASTHGPVLHFGVPGDAKKVDVVVNWPTGRTESFRSVPVGRRYSIREGSDKIVEV